MTFTNLRIAKYNGVVVGVAEFSYISDLRRWYSDDGRYINVEIDIKNTGNAAGSCTVTFNYDAAWPMTITYIKRSATIQPGETVTFSARIQNEPDDPDFWIRIIGVSSEAGIYTVDFGTSCALVSWYVPPKIVSGNVFWAEMTVNLPYFSNRFFTPRLRIEGRSYPRWETDICGALIAPTTWPFYEIALDHTGEYHIKGILKWGYTDGAPVCRGHVKMTGAEYGSGVYACPAETKFTHKYHGYWSAPPGIYDIRASLFAYTIVGPDTYMGGDDLWADVVIGQMEIV